MNFLVRYLDKERWKAERKEESERKAMNDRMLQSLARSALELALKEGFIENPFNEDGFRQSLDSRHNWCILQLKYFLGDPTESNMFKGTMDERTLVETVESVLYRITYFEKFPERK